MRRIRITVEYDGTAYCGWQVQPNGVSIQEKLEQAVTQLTGEPARVRGASRTDSGVHARGQVAVFDTGSRIPAERFAVALNSCLPDDIAVTASAEAAPDFDPRRGAARKLYRYTIHNSPCRPALAFRFAWHLKQPLDAARMSEAARLFEGEHDFTSFSRQECNTPDADNRRLLFRSEIICAGESIIYEVEGRSFLYNMVRNLVGTLVDVGSGLIEPGRIPEILARRNRAAAGQGAPAKGLCLEWIRYYLAGVQIT